MPSPKGMVFELLPEPVTREACAAGGAKLCTNSVQSRALEKIGRRESVLAVWVDDKVQRSTQKAPPLLGILPGVRPRERSSN
jgi:hypothetical protein